MVRGICGDKPREKEDAENYVIRSFIIRAFSVFFYTSKNIDLKSSPSDDRKPD